MLATTRSVRRTRRTPPVAAVVIVVTLLAATMAPAHADQVAEPHADPFYDPPADFEDEPLGTVLRTREVSVTALGLPMPVDATQALVRSSDSHGEAMAIVTTLMIPQVPHAGGARPLLSYQPATDSLGDQCQPSYTLRTGTEKELPLLTMGLLQGWAVVVTDYQGPHNAYPAGRLEGQATLDGIRGALAIPGTGLGPDTPVGMWGYSGGAVASGWAAELAPSYAPELDVVGVASGGTPADVEAAARAVDGTIASGLALSAAVGLSREYPELLTLLNDKGRAMVQDLDDTCVSDAVSSYPFRRLAEFTTSHRPIDEPIARSVFATNRMGQAAPTAPVYLYHSFLDQLIPYRSAKTLHDRWCARGASVLLVTDYLSEHVTYAISGAPGAVGYLASRFAGVPVPDNCRR